MQIEPDKTKAPPDRAATDADKSGTGTEAAKKGGVEPAKRQAERDWQDSPKESGD